MGNRSSRQTVFNNSVETRLDQLAGEKKQVHYLTTHDIRQLVKKDKDYPTLKALVLIGLLVVVTKALMGVAALETCKPYVLSAYHSILGAWQSIAQFFSSLW